jgi:hypothetical protein
LPNEVGLANMIVGTDVGVGHRFAAIVQGGADLLWPQLRDSKHLGLGLSGRLHGPECQNVAQDEKQTDVAQLFVYCGYRVGVFPLGKANFNQILEISTHTISPGRFAPA